MVCKFFSDILLEKKTSLVGGILEINVFYSYGGTMIHLIQFCGR